jgi:hypothetical protein
VLVCAPAQAQTNTVTNAREIQRKLQSDIGFDLLEKNCVLRPGLTTLLIYTILIARPKG